MSSTFRRDSSGAVAVEFSFVALPFFGLVFGFMQVGLIFMTDILLETAVADAARMIRVGQAQKAGWGISQFNSQVCSELYSLLDCTQLQTFAFTPGTFGAVNLAVPVDPKTGTFTNQPSYTSNVNSAQQVVVITTYYEYQTLFADLGLSIADQPNGTRLLGATAAFRNESF